MAKLSLESLVSAGTCLSKFPWILLIKIRKLNCGQIFLAFRSRRVKRLFKPPSGPNVISLEVTLSRRCNQMIGESDLRVHSEVRSQNFNWYLNALSDSSAEKKNSRRHNYSSKLQNACASREKTCVTILHDATPTTST